MQYFKDTETGTLYAFDDDVRCEQNAQGVWQFFALGSDEPLAGPYPVSLEPTAAPVPTESETPEEPPAPTDEEPQQ